MVTSAFKLLVVVLALTAGVARAQVVLGPGNQSGSPGEVVEFAFSVFGPSAADAAIARFRLAYDPAGAVFAPVLTNPTTGEVDCTVAPDLADRVTTGPVVSKPADGAVIISFGDFAPPLTSIGRGGEVLRCRFQIREDAALGTYPLACVGVPTVSDPSGASLPASCTDGVLTVQPPVVVTLGPGNQSASPGGIVEFGFSIAGPSAADVAIARFKLAYDPATAVFVPVLKNPTTGEVDCSVAADLAGRITTGPVFSQPSEHRIVISFGDFTAPITAIGRAGEVVRCRFQISSQATPGTYPLACSGAATASDVGGKTLAASCRDGSLALQDAPPTPTPTFTPTPTVTPTPTFTRPPTCTGDKDGNGGVDATEVVLAVRAFSEDNLSLNPATDPDGNGTVDAREVVRAVLNFSQDECLP